MTKKGQLSNSHKAAFTSGLQSGAAAVVTYAYLDNWSNLFVAAWVAVTIGLSHMAEIARR